MKISNEVKQALEILGYEKWTSVQEKVMPLFLEQKNIVVKSQTGSGKTAAFAIPMMELIQNEIKHPQALILTCTRELAMQVKEECALLGKYKKMKVQALIGKENIENQKALLKQQCHILVASVGRLLDLIQQGYVVLDDLKMCVVDEADYMLELGFLEDVDKVLAYLPDNVQTAFFSATYPEAIQTLIWERVKDAVYVEVEENVQISHFYAQSENPIQSLYEYLTTLDIQSAIVFCERKEEVKNVYTFLKEKQIPVSYLHGDLFQKQRFENLLKFKKGESKVLVASDVAARGLDIDKVSHVFHIGNITNVERYIHRCGRSGRKDEKGCSIVLMKDVSNTLSLVLEQFHSKDIKEYVVQGQNEIFCVQTKVLKQDLFDAHIEKIYINAGSEKKVRAGDIIGALCALDNISQEDIGVVEVLRKMSYVEIYHHKANYVVENMQNKTIKKKKVKVEIAQ